MFDKPTVYSLSTITINTTGIKLYFQQKNYNNEYNTQIKIDT